MRIITFNANGIRSAQRKGFFDWFSAQNADVLCWQETKAQRDQLEGGDFFPAGYHCYFKDAEKKGYSGVAIYSRTKPDAVIDNLGWAPFDSEGRYIEARFGNLSAVSLYLPSGSSGDERQAFKYEVLAFVENHFAKWMKSGRQYVLCGDFNIAHHNIDLKNWKGNLKNSGFLPDERAWMSKLLDQQGWLDTFRKLKPEVEEYTWWSNRGQARANNVGWRIDYQLASANLSSALQATSIYREHLYSDHAPMTVDYDLESNL